MTEGIFEPAVAIVLEHTEFDTRKHLRKADDPYTDLTDGRTVLVGHPHPAATGIVL